MTGNAAGYGATTANTIFACTVSGGDRSEHTGPSQDTVVATTVMTFASPGTITFSCIGAVTFNDAQLHAIEVESVR